MKKRQKLSSDEQSPVSVAGSTVKVKNELKIEFYISTEARPYPAESHR